MNIQINSLLKTKGIRITPIRLLVSEVFLNNQNALSQYDIQDQLPWMDNVSIFRTLKTFEKHALIHKIIDGKTTKYALCSEDCSNYHKIHPHFNCEQCSKTFCLKEQHIQIDHLPNNFKITDYNLVLKGLCADCYTKTGI